MSGTPQYMSPESISAPAEVDGRSDLYAVGAVAYYLLSGLQVFEGKSVVEVLGQHLYTAAPALSSRTRADVPQSLERLLMACLEKDPSRRPPSASSFLESLLAVPTLTGWNTTTALDWWQTHRQSADSARPPAEAAFTIEVRDPAQRLTHPLVGD